MGQKSTIAIVAAILTAGALIAWAILLSDPNEKIKAIVRAKLSDPGSAIFQKIAKTKAGDYCGEVNAKNQFGGYVGFKRFLVYDSGGGRFELMDIESIVDKECK